MACQVKVMVPLNVKNGLLVTFAKAETLCPRMENVPNIEKPVMTCTRHVVTTRTKLDAVQFPLVAKQLQVLCHEPLACVSWASLLILMFTFRDRCYLHF